MSAARNLDGIIGIYTVTFSFITQESKMESLQREHGKGASFSRFSGICYFGAGLLLVAICLYWYSMVASADGPGWLRPRLDSASACTAPSLAILAMAAVSGWMTGISLPIRRSAGALRAAAVLAGGLLLALVWRSLHRGALALAPDWYGITLAVLAGSSFAAGYAKGGFVEAGKPLWPVLIIPAVAMVAAVSQTSCWGALIAVVVLLALTDALGRWMISFSGPPEAAPAFVRGALGISIVIFIFRISGQLGGAGALATLTTLVALAVLTHRHLAAGCRSLSSWLGAGRVFTFQEWVLVGAGVALAAVYWLPVLAPETGSDALGGRSALPILWSRHGSISGVPEIFLSYMGIGAEVLNLSVVSLAGGSVAKVVTFACAIWLAGAFLWSARDRGWFLPLLACLTFFCSSVVSWMFIHGFADLQVTFLTVAAFAVFELWEQDRRPFWVFAAGVVGGSAVAVKLNAATVLVVMALMLLWYEGACKGRLWPALKSAAIFGLGAALCLGPALARSYLLTGNPMFPFARHVFRSPMLAEPYMPNLPKPELGAAALTLPFRTVLSPLTFNELGTYHPAFWILALAGLALLPWSRPTARRWWILAGAFWIGWLVTEQNVRYSMPALACTAMAVAACGRLFPRPARWLLWSGTLLLLLGFALNLSRPTAWMWGPVSGPAFPRNLATGQVSTAEFENNQLPSAELGARANATYGSSAVIWEIPCFRDHQSFLGRTISFPHGDARILKPLMDQFDKKSRASESQEYAVLLDQKITHVLLAPDSPYVENLPESAWPSILAPSFTQKYLALDAADQNFRLYRVRSRDAATAGVASVIPRQFNTGENVSVEPGSLIGVRAAWAAPLLPSAYVNLGLYSNDGRLVFYYRIPFGFNSANAWHCFWQTVPDGAVNLRLDTSPEMGNATILLLYESHSHGP